MCPIISPDFTEIANVDPGVYKVRITGCDPKQSKKGDMYLRWTFEVFGNEKTSLNGRKVFHNTMVSGPGAGGLKKLITATIGSVDGQLDTDLLLGKELTVVLVTGTDQNGNPSDFPEVKSVAKLVG